VPSNPADEATVPTQPQVVRQALIVIPIPNPSPDIIDCCL